MADQEVDGRFHEFSAPVLNKAPTHYFVRACVICGHAQVRSEFDSEWRPLSATEPDVAACWETRGNHMLNVGALQMQIQKILMAEEQSRRIQPVPGRIIPN